MLRFLKWGAILPSLAATLVLSGCPFGPRVEVSSELLRFNFDSVSQTYETVEEFVISNAGAGELEYTIAVDQPWISVSPASGTAITPETPVTVTVTVNRDFSTLKAADFSTATLSISTNGGDVEVTATVAPDFFTEAFGPGDVDLEGLALTYVPDGSVNFYQASKSTITELPTDPEEARAFPLDFDAFGDPVKAGLFGDEKITYYGEEYDTLYISSQGWVSFGAVGNDPTTVEDHFENPQISGLPVDASGADSTVSYLQDEEKLVITYENAETKGAPGFENNFQLELFFDDGTVQMSFTDVDPALAGVIGLSDGSGSGGSVPEGFVPSDLTGVNTGELKIVQ